MIDHPLASKGPLAHIDLSIVPVREKNYEADEIALKIEPSNGFAGSNILWQLITRVLISFSPPEQDWDRFGNRYANIAEVGSWQNRVAQLDELISSKTLAESIPGSMSHYSHRKNLAEGAIEGTAVRAMCGVFFVPIQDHQNLPACPNCKKRYAELPT